MLGRLLTAEKSLRGHMERQKALQKELSSQHALEKTLRASAAHLRQHLESCQVLFLLAVRDGAASKYSREAQDILFAAEDDAAHERSSSVSAFQELPGAEYHGHLNHPCCT